MRESWLEIDPVPGTPGRLAATAQAVADKVYVLGGYTVAEDGTEVSWPGVYQLDPKTNRYTELEPMPVPVDDASVELQAAAAGDEEPAARTLHSDGFVEQDVGVRDRERAPVDIRACALLRPVVHDARAHELGVAPGDRSQSTAAFRGIDQDLAIEGLIAGIEPPAINVPLDPLDSGVA